MNANAKISKVVPVSVEDPSVESVIALVDEMIVVIERENEELARGLPAPMSSLVARKNVLADRFERCVATIKERRVSISAGNEVLRRRLVDRTNVLRDRMAENIERLQSAIEASRQRVEAIMHAIRHHVAAESPYGANGRIAPLRTVNDRMSRQV
jgi:hypothetical protein